MAPGRTLGGGCSRRAAPRRAAIPFLWVSPREPRSKWLLERYYDERKDVMQRLDVKPVPRSVARGCRSGWPGFDTAARRARGAAGPQVEQYGGLWSGAELW